MPNGLFYRWEDHNHGLEHKCGTCATVLSSPRAKKTCFGVHEEVCTRYHKTLFYVGQSHHCDACHKSIEVHDKRHRQIATIMLAIRRLEEKPVPMFNKKRKGKKSKNLPVNNSDLEAVCNEVNEDHQEIAWENESSTLNNEDVLERALAMDDADARKAAKAERKIAKNQVRFDVITKEDLDLIQNALHPEVRLASEEPNQGQGLFDNDTIDQNIAFNTHTFKYGSLRQGANAKRTLKNNTPHKTGDPVNPDQAEEILNPILKALSIETKLTKASRERKNLDAKLRNAIMSDLVAFENEQAETMERMAGYWRYVNKRTYNQMVENNELWDWATGQKLLKVDESELDTIEEEDESAEEESLTGSTPDTTPITSPESWDNDEDFEFPADGTPLFGRKALAEDADGQKTPTQATYAMCSENPEQYAERTRKLFDDMHLPRLSFSPGRSPGPTLTFQVPSPSSSDDEPYEEYWDDCGTPTMEGSVTPKANEASRSPLSPITPIVRRRFFEGKKDTRTCNQIVYVREASPPREDPTAWPSPWSKAPSPSTIPPTCADINNHFGNLDREVPAPCEEEPKSPETPCKAKIITLALPAGNPSPTAEDGWEIQTGPKKNSRNFPKLAGANKKGAGGQAPKQGKGGGGPSYAKIAAGGAKKR